MLSSTQPEVCKEQELDSGNLSSNNQFVNSLIQVIKCEQSSVLGTLPTCHKSIQSTTKSSEKQFGKLKVRQNYLTQRLLSESSKNAEGET